MADWGQDKAFPGVLGRVESADPAAAAPDALRCPACKEPLVAQHSDDEHTVWVCPCPDTEGWIDWKEHRALSRFVEKHDPDSGSQADRST